MLTYLAHAGHDHGEGASTNPALIIGVVAVAAILITLLVVFDRKRAQAKRKTQKEAEE